MRKRRWNSSCSRSLASLELLSRHRWRPDPLRSSRRSSPLGAPRLLQRRLGDLGFRFMMSTVQSCYHLKSREYTKFETFDAALDEFYSKIESQRSEQQQRAKRS